METTTTLHPPMSDADYAAEIDRYIAEMKLTREHIAESHRRTEILRAETEAMLQDTLKSLKIA